MICLVSDRRRADPIEQARRAVEAGIDLIQIRERDLEAGDLLALTGEMVAVTRGSRTRVVVNDRLDVALAAGAGGVHLRADSIPVAAARRIAPPGFLIGRSVHGVSEAIAASGADYLIAGTVFASASKPAGWTLLGLDGLRAIAEAVAVPVLAIGGIDLGRLDDLASAGAAGLAAIGLFTSSHSGVELRQTVNRVRTVFDRPNTTP